MQFSAYLIWYNLISTSWTLDCFATTIRIEERHDALDLLVAPLHLDIYTMC